MDLARGQAVRELIEMIMYIGMSDLKTLMKSVKLLILKVKPSDEIDIDEVRNTLWE